MRQIETLKQCQQLRNKKRITWCIKIGTKKINKLCSSKYFTIFWASFQFLPHIQKSKPDVMSVLSRNTVRCCSTVTNTLVQVSVANSSCQWKSPSCKSSDSPAGIWQNSYQHWVWGMSGTNRLVTKPIISPLQKHNLKIEKLFTTSA